MFNKPPKKNADDGAMTQVDQEVLVHNMPRAAKTIEIKSSPVAANGGFVVAEGPDKKSRLVGIVIIAGGAILIGLLVFLSYRFVIKPSSGQPDSPNATDSVAPVAENIPATTTTEASIEIVATTSVPIVEVATSSEQLTASTSSDTNVSALPPILDSDNDGLIDQEEIAIGTDPAQVDTNGNTYPDLLELNNNYNPSGSGRLEASAGLMKYNSQAHSYSLLYPKSWLLKDVDDNLTTTFNAPDNSIIQVSVQENSDQESILAWYEKSFPDMTPTYDKLRSGVGWDGVYSEDKLNFYLTSKDKKNIYIFSYIPATEKYLLYPNIFNLMIGSFTLK